MTNQQLYDIQAETEKRLKEIVEDSSGLKVDGFIKTPLKPKNLCKLNCSVCKSSVQGHGWVDWICLISGEDAPLGKECPYSEEEIHNKYESLRGKRVLIL